MASPLRQIFAFSGVLDSGAGEKNSFALVEPGKRAWRVGPGPAGRYTEEPIEPRLI